MDQSRENLRIAKCRMMSLDVEVHYNVNHTSQEIKNLAMRLNNTIRYICTCTCLCRKNWHKRK